MKYINYVLMLSLIVFVIGAFTQYTLAQNDMSTQTSNADPNNANNNVMSNTSIRSDADIISDINAKLAADASVSGKRVRIRSSNGMVTIEGNVDTDRQASTIIQIVSSVNGVRDTDASGLKIKSSSQPFTDTAITAKVKGSFIREKLFGDRNVNVMGINVETINGIVYLSGVVETQEEADNAATITKSVSGVKSVDSRITINPNMNSSTTMPRK